MTSPQLAHWRLLRPGAAAAVLCVDFGPRTGQEGFAKLAAGLDPGPPVYETIPPKPTADLDRSATPERYLSHWIGAVIRSGLDTRAVLAFCAGGGFAGALAAAIGSTGTPVVLINPTLTTPAGMLAEFDQAVAVLGDRVTDDEVRSARPPAQDCLLTTAEALVAGYRALAGVAFERAGIGPRFAEGLIERFAAYLCYLLAAARCAAEAPPEPALVLSSPEHSIPARYQAMRHEIPSRYEESLADPLMAKLVTRALRDGR